MASRKIADLKPDLQIKAYQLIRRCKDLGVEMLIYCTYRSPEEQAKLYRQSRSGSRIQKKIDSFNGRGLEFLAAVLIGVGPQKGKLGRHVTGAGPGESWHQYGFAFDAVPIIRGKCAWDVKKWPYLWKIYATIAIELGLITGAEWKDYPHCQGWTEHNPTKIWTPTEVQERIIYQL